MKNLSANQHHHSARMIHVGGALRAAGFVLAAGAVFAPSVAYAADVASDAQPVPQTFTLQPSPVLPIARGATAALAVDHNMLRQLQVGSPVRLNMVELSGPAQGIVTRVDHFAGGFTAHGEFQLVSAGQAASAQDRFMFTVVESQSETVVAGALWVGAEVYELRTGATGQPVITRTTGFEHVCNPMHMPAAQPSEGAGIGSAPAALAGGVVHVDDNEQPVTSAPMALAATSAPSAPAATDDGSVIDVLVVYTSEARLANGGEAGTLALINAAVASANTALANSGVVLTYNLAGAAEINYAETGNYEFDLLSMAQVDGVLDEVLVLRDALQADLVTMMVNQTDGGIVGLAQLGPDDENTAFSVVNDDFAVGNYTFAHELAHNIGARHDRAGTSQLHPYAHGHLWTGSDNTSYRSVMGTGVGTRVPYFSDPDVLLDGVPTGIAAPASNAADNARFISEQQATVANYRSGPITATDCNGNGVFDQLEHFSELIVRDSGQPVSIDAGQPLSRAFPGMPTVGRDVTLSVDAIGDFSGSDEYLDVTVNNTFVARLFENNGGQDCVTPLTAQVAIPSAVFNAGSGTVQISIAASAPVSPTLCNLVSGSSLSFEFSLVATDPLVDADGNGVLDACEQQPCPADTDNNGVINGLDFNAVLNAFGASQGQPAFNTAADTDNNNVINGLDFNAILNQFGQACP